MDFRDKRRKMVKDQIQNRGVKDEQVLNAILSVARERFVPPDLRRCAYEDKPLPIGYGQTISQPYIVAYMTELLQISPGCRVLEIGTGSGYQTAILASLGVEVYSVEKVRELAERARQVLSEEGYRNVEVIYGDGFEVGGEFDRIILTASPRQIPDNLVNSLSRSGILIGPEGEEGNQWIVRITRDGTGGITRERLLPVRFVPMF